MLVFGFEVLLLEEEVLVFGLDVLLLEEDEEVLVFGLDVLLLEEDEEVLVFGLDVLLLEDDDVLVLGFEVLLLDEDEDDPPDVPLGFGALLAPSSCGTILIMLSDVILPSGVMVLLTLYLSELDLPDFTISCLAENFTVYSKEPFSFLCFTIS